MHRWYRGIILVGLVALALALLAGCASRERRKVTVTEEQHEGEVVEEAPGEMIVE